MKTKLTLIALAFLLIGCNLKKERKETFILSASIGKLTFENAMFDLYEKDSVITLKQIDSLYNLEIEKTAKRLYDE